MEETIDTRSGRFLVRPYELSDEASVLELWRAAFGHPMDVRLWRWKYHTPPFGRNILLCFAPDNQPVIFYAGLPYVGLWKERPVRLLHITDSMSHPAYRGTIGGRKGLFVQTTERFFVQYGDHVDTDAMYGFPGERHFKLGALLLRYRAIARRPLYFKIAVTHPQLKIQPFRGFLSKVTASHPHLNTIHRKLSDFYPLAILRDTAFLTWRFQSHPLHTYSIYACTTLLKGTVKGYIVLRDRDATQPESVIVDMFMPPDAALLRSFLARVAHLAQQKGIAHLRLWLPEGHAITRTLMALNIYPDPEPLGIIPVARSFSSKLVFSDISDQLYYTMADGDLF